jgi:hypothetical protein
MTPCVREPPKMVPSQRAADGVLHGFESENSASTSALPS